MPTIPRRVVTRHDQRGVSVLADDGPVPVVRTKSIVDAFRRAGR